MLFRSESLSSAIILAWIVRSIIARFEPNSSTHIEMLNTLIDRLYCLIKLNILYLCGKKSILDNAQLLDLGSASFNLRAVLNKGKGVLSEITAKHVILNEFQPKLLTVYDEDEDNNDKVSGLEEDKKSTNESSQFKITFQEASVDFSVILKDSHSKEFYDSLQEARKYLAKSLESDTLLVYSAWESIKAYNKDTEYKIKNLENSLRYASEIGNAIVKQGILSLIWHNYLSKRLKLLTELIDKVGKLPKDKLVRKEIGINEESVLKFLECIMASLDLIMDANCSINEVPIFNYDQFWKNHIDDLNIIPTNVFLSFPSSSSPSNDLVSESTSTTTMTTSNTTSTTAQNSIINSTKPLVELACEQKYVNYHLCLFQYQLIRILYLTIRYNLKSVRPLSFFDTKGIQALFSELHTHPLLTSDADIKILNARKLFFTKAMNAIMANVESPANIKAKLSKEITDNLNIVFNLSKDMGVDFEYIKRYYCCMLYALNYHSEAEKILHTLKEIELVAAQLLVVVGYKLNEMFELKFDAHLVAILSTNLNSWLRSIGPSDYRIYTNNTSKKPLLELMGIILNRLPDTFSEYKIAVELYDFIENPEFQLK